MLYEVLRITARFALRWYYSELIVEGRENIPLDGPLLVVANHPNALVDAMVVATTIHRRVLVTARASLFERRTLASLLRRTGVVPLLRVQDVAANGEARGLLVRNDSSLERVTDALQQGEVVLIFPEGVSHDQPSMAPLKSGAARIALQAFGKGAESLAILPVGLVYEEKERPGSNVLVRLGRPIGVAEWFANNPNPSPAALTREISRELCRVTLNTTTGAPALPSVHLARALSVLLDEEITAARDGALENEPQLVRRIDEAIDAYQYAPLALQHRADVLIGSLHDFEMRLAQHGVIFDNTLVAGSLAAQGYGSPLRERVLACVVLLLTALGRVTAWIPLHAARGLAMYSLRSDRSRDQPAMRTILIGLVMVPAWYVLQAAAVTMLVGGRYAAVWLFVCVVGAYVDARFSLPDRKLQRIRTGLVKLSGRHSRECMIAEARELVQRARDLTTELVRDRAAQP